MYLKLKIIDTLFFWYMSKNMIIKCHIKKEKQRTINLKYNIRFV